MRYLRVDVRLGLGNVGFGCGWRWSAGVFCAMYCFVLLFYVSERLSAGRKIVGGLEMGEDNFGWCRIGTYLQIGTGWFSLV